MLSPLPRVRRGFGAVAAAAILAGSIGACGQAGSSQPPGGTPVAAASGGSACPSAPVPGDLPDWRPPSTAPAIYPLIIANTGELTCGKNRVIFTFLDASNNVLSKPSRTASVAFYDLGRDPKKAIASVDGTFVWAIQDARGIYVTSADFPEAGTYGA